jgi:hypothetical protein
MDATVHRLAHQAVRYLHDLGLPATEPKRHRSGALPYYMADAFELVELDIAGQTVVLAIDDEAERSPAEVEQLMRKLGAVLESTAAYVIGSLNSYDRKRLIERRVPFLVPGNQLYLPGLGMDLREHFRKPTERRPLSPSAQAVLIVILQHPAWTTELTAAEIAAKLDYTPMTASRAARQLAAAGLAELHKAPNGQRMTLIKSPSDTWELALPLLRSPVQRIVYAKMFALQPPPSGLGDVVEAGMSALARNTMLAKDGPDVFACSRASWEGWKKWVQVLPHADDNTDEVQIWSYPPTLNKGETHATATGGVDPLSLYLSLRDIDDPRVQSALEELMEHVWR